MSCYISSNNNRFYVAAEEAYGAVAAVTAVNRIPAVTLSIKQRSIHGHRKDKTGSRSYAGSPSGVRQRTQFDLTTYLTSWQAPTTEPSYGPLFRAALGGSVSLHSGATVAAMPTPTQLTLTAPHNLAVGQAVSFAGDIRFVDAIVNPTTILLNAPFTTTPISGAQVTPTATYALAQELPSISLFDYWSPATAIQRIASGAAVDTLKIKINGDFHEFTFSGEAKDIVDSVSFSSGLAGLTQFPGEPAIGNFDYSIVPGNLGQAWLGTAAAKFLTVTSAEVTVDNNMDLRRNEFGSDRAACITAGQRNVSVNFNLFQQDNDETKALYQAAKQRSPISVFFQLGEQAGQLFGIYMKSVIIELPEYNDNQTRVEWQFKTSRAQGTLDDEIYMAFA